MFPQFPDPTKNISFWFACKSCKGYFRTVIDFIEHKKEYHFNEFRTTSSVIFEEKRNEVNDHSLVSPLRTHVYTTQVSPPASGSVDPTAGSSGHDPRPSQSRQLRHFESENRDDLYDDEVSRNNEESDLNQHSLKVLRNTTSQKNGRNATENTEAVDDDDLGTCLLEPKSEFTTFDSFENQEEKNPFVLVKRLTAKEIENATFPNRTRNGLNDQQQEVSTSFNPLLDGTEENDNELSDPTYCENLKSTQRSSTMQNSLRSVLVCKLCSQEFKYRLQLKIHGNICSKQHALGNRYCVQCNMVFSRSTVLRKHRQRRHGAEKNAVNCTVCPKKYETEASLKKHMKSEHVTDQGSVLEPLPSNRNNSTTNLNEDFEGDLLRNLEQCSTNNVPSTSNNATSQNIDILPANVPAKDSSNPFECKLCLVDLKTDEEFQIHRNDCTLTHPHRHRYCIQCNLKFSRPSALQKHYLRRHATPEEKAEAILYKNSVVEQPSILRSDSGAETFTSKPKAMTHQKAELKLFKCPNSNCGRIFKRKALLAQHIVVHSDARPFVCQLPLCGRAYKHRPLLMDHLRSHSGERPFKCPVDGCEKAYLTRSNMINHKRIAHRTK